MSTPTDAVSTPTPPTTAPVRRAAVPPHRGHGRGRRRRPDRRGRAAAAVLALAAVTAVACLFPAVRTQFRESFTRMPDPYQELYFTRTPSVDRGVTVVPVSLRDHGESGRAYRVRAWLRSDDGADGPARTATLVPRSGAAADTAAAVLRLAPRSGPVTVYVQLLGHSQTLHFRLAGQRPPDTEGSS